MSRRTTWKELFVGLVSLAAVAGAGLAILFFARIGTLHGKSFRLYAQTGEARGVIGGSEVWLGGQKVGLVKDVRFLPTAIDQRSRLLLSMDVLESARDNIRLDSYAQIRPGGTLIGAPVVYLTIGTSASRSARTGDTIRSLPQTDVESMASEFALASRHFPEIIANVKLLGQQLHSVDGSLGAMGIEQGGPELVTTRARLARLTRSLGEPSSTMGLALNSRTSIAERAKAAMARADSVRQLLASDRTSFGRFRRDSTLVREVADIRSEIDIVRARMAAPTGTLGRAQTDSAIFAALSGMQREMGLLFADLRRRPLRYIRF